MKTPKRPLRIAAPLWLAAPLLLACPGATSAGQDGGDPPAPETAQEPEPLELPADGSVPIRTGSGLTISVLEAPEEGGATPAYGDVVTVHYTGFLEDGTVFDTSRRGRVPGAPVTPVEFRVGKVIDGWNEALTLMQVGQRVKLTIPPDLAYGDAGAGGDAIPPGATLVFDVELIGVEPGPVLPPAPEFRGAVVVDEAGARVEADGAPVREDRVVVLPSGLRYRVVEPGAGEAPTEDEFFELDFTLYSPNGRLLDATAWEESGPLVTNRKFAQLGFVKEIGAILREGMVLELEVPRALAYQGAQVPDAGPDDPTLWRLLVTEIQRLPEFVAPDPAAGVTTDSGLLYQVLTEGTGEPPTSDQPIALAYTCWTPSGELIDSSRLPQKGPLRAPCGDFGLDVLRELPTLMQVGEVVVVRVPPELGFGEQPVPGLEPGEPSIWRLELVEILPAPVTPDFRPLDPAAAVELGSGLKKQVLRAGNGRRPGDTQTVEVHYSGWLTDGTQFDSSYERGATAEFPLNRVIPGWIIGLATMQEGEIALLEIPSDLAYGDRGQGDIPPGATLIFQVELIRVVR